MSDNLHAGLMPYMWAIYVAGAETDLLKAGFAREHALLARAGLDLTRRVATRRPRLVRFFHAAFHGELLGVGRASAVVRSLCHGLPSLGVDGTLFNIQNGIAADGKVHAKTGTWGSENHLNADDFVTKGLAGYMTTRHGRHHLAFAFYINRMAGNPERRSPKRRRALRRRDARRDGLPTSIARYDVSTAEVVARRGVVLFRGQHHRRRLLEMVRRSSRSAAMMAFTMDAIIRADRIFTIPGIVLLLIGGFGAAFVGDIPILSTGWILWGLVCAFSSSGVASAHSHAFSDNCQRRRMPATSRNTIGFERAGIYGEPRACISGSRSR